MHTRCCNPSEFVQANAATQPSAETGHPRWNRGLVSLIESINRLHRYRNLRAHLFEQAMLDAHCSHSARCPGES